MRFRAGVMNPEGPVSLADGGWLFTEMDIGAISYINKEGSHSHHIAKTGLPNGLALDNDGAIWVADSRQRALLKLTDDEEAKSVSRGSQEEPFLLPNDLCFGPDGCIYLTDSGTLLETLRNLSDPAAAYNLDFDGKVYQVDPGTGKCRIIDRGLRLTNGIAFGPRGEHLYVAETITGNIYRYQMNEQRGVPDRELFGNVMKRSPSEYGKIAGPDGMAFDIRGNLYVAVLVEGNITVLDPSGDIKERIAVEGDLPTNLAFDSSGLPRMLITEASKNQLLLIEVSHPGLPLFN